MSSRDLAVDHVAQLGVFARLAAPHGSIGEVARRQFVLAALAQCPRGAEVPRFAQLRLTGLPRVLPRRGRRAHRNGIETEPQVGPFERPIHSVQGPVVLAVLAAPSEASRNSLPSTERYRWRWRRCSRRRAPPPFPRRDTACAGQRRASTLRPVGTRPTPVEARDADVPILRAVVAGRLHQAVRVGSGDAPSRAAHGEVRRQWRHEASAFPLPLPSSDERLCPRPGR